MVQVHQELRVQQEVQDQQAFLVLKVQREVLDQLEFKVLLDQQDQQDRQDHQDPQVLLVHKDPLDLPDQQVAPDQQVPQVVQDLLVFKDHREEPDPQVQREVLDQPVRLVVQDPQVQLGQVVHQEDQSHKPVR